MLRRILIFILLFSFNKTQAQFQFTGNVNHRFRNATVYLSIVKDCNKKSLFFAEHIIQECKIDSSNTFTFNGDLLVEENQIYKIHIDNCSHTITDYKHFLNHCEHSKEILFIAHNNDSIHFPLNNLSQIFCEMDHSSERNLAIYKIESLREELLDNLQLAKSEIQRENIYKKHFSSLQEFGKSFDEPLAELYAFYLYASDNSFSKKYYLVDLIKSDYYNELLSRLEEKYPNSSYAKLYKIALTKDQYPLVRAKNNNSLILTIILAVLLLVSVVFNIYLYKEKENYLKNNLIDYKAVLTAQELKVFELMLKKSNKEIADELFVSLSTVKSHINNIYSKLNISSRKDIPRFID
ncbi:MAG: helix-turn-helix transcriptional regulator [Flavobacteriales bacterium]|nr:helix-turn-helix transcriptional regulator [Flavobacteriales bacterium]